jgi:cysteine desulfurase/selenocysteine lyase
MLNVNKIREDFPILQQKIKGKPVIYFDSACYSLKPRQVVEAMNRFYYEFSSCHGRSVHKFSKQTTDEYEKAREKIAKFINAKPNEIIFTKNTTEGINLVAYSLGLNKGDKVITTNLEHNSNLLPWFMLAKKIGIMHEMTNVTSEGEFDFDNFSEKIDGAKLVSIFHTSNVMATTVPAKEIAKICHDNGSLLMLDGAQSVPHKVIDVKKLDADFLAFSIHKMLGPSGVGVLYGKHDILKKMDPFIVGGETIRDVDFGSPVFEEPPAKFEAGLQNYAGVIGAGEAIEYLNKIKMEDVERYEEKLSEALTEGLSNADVILHGPKYHKKRCALAAFTVKDVNPHDVAMLLDDTANIMVRSGMHCCHLFHKHILNLPNGSVRASLYLYNTEEEIKIFLENLEKIVKLLG